MFAKPQYKPGIYIRARNPVRLFILRQDEQNERNATEGYFDFIVPPLEGLWWFKDGGVIADILDKDHFRWMSMIRQPDFVTDDVFKAVKHTLAQKRPDLDLSRARLLVQMNKC